MTNPIHTRMQPRCTTVLVTLTVKEDVDLSRVMALMPNEMRDTALLYLDGKITQWFSQGDGKGVVFLFAADSAKQVSAWTADLSLVREALVDLTFLPLGPLMPMRVLLNNPGDRQL